MSNKPIQKPLRVAVIGAGLMGRRHALAYRSLDGVDVVGFVDRDAAAAAKVGEAFGVPCHADWDALYAAAELDAVSICLPDKGSIAG